MVTELANQVNKSIAELLNGVHTAIPGKVVEFDKEKCEAVIQPFGKLKMPNGAFIDYPKLNEVPIMLFQGNSQNTAIGYPVLPGDECLLIMSEYTLDTWRGNSEQSENDLKFDLTNAVAIVGLFSKPNALAKEAVEDDALIIKHNKNRVIFKGEDEITLSLSGGTSKITLKPDGVTIETNGDSTVKTKGSATLETDGDTRIKSAGNTSIESGGDINISASGNVKITGSRIDLN